MVLTQPTVKSFTVPTDKVKVLSNSKIDVDGRQLIITKTAFDDLIKLSGLTKKTINHLNTTINRNAGFTLVKELMKAISQRSGQNLALLIDPDDRQVKRIVPEGQAEMGTGISATSMQEMMEYALNSSKKAVLTDTYVSDGGTKVTMNLKWDNPVNFGLRGEEISLGKQIKWDMYGLTSVSDFAERLICTNGMTAIRPGEEVYLNGESSPAEWYKQLFEDIINPNREFLNHYHDRVLEAMNTNLSVYEYNKVKSHLSSHFPSDDNRITRYLGDERWKNEYSKRAIELDKATVKQLQNCPTPVNSWGAINCMTDLASHKYGKGVSDWSRAATQRFAGKLLNRNWDANQQITNVPEFEVIPHVN